MTDSELNEAVARKLGDKASYDMPMFPDPIRQGLPQVKDYCHSIAAAWEIVEFIKPKGVGLFSHMMPPYGWTCSVWTPMTEEPDFKVRADTAPMAICKAFLKVGEK